MSGETAKPVKTWTCADGVEHRRRLSDDCPTCREEDLLSRVDSLEHTVANLHCEVRDLRVELRDLATRFDREAFTRADAPTEPAAPVVINAASRMCVAQDRLIRALADTQVSKSYRVEMDPEGRADAALTEFLHARREYDDLVIEATMIKDGGSDE